MRKVWIAFAVQTGADKLRVHGTYVRGESKLGIEQTLQAEGRMHVLEALYSVKGEKLRLSLIRDTELDSASVTITFPDGSSFNMSFGSNGGSNGLAIDEMSGRMMECDDLNRIIELYLGDISTLPPSMSQPANNLLAGLISVGDSLQPQTEKLDPIQYEECHQECLGECHQFNCNSCDPFIPPGILCSLCLTTCNAGCSIGCSGD